MKQLLKYYSFIFCLGLIYPSVQLSAQKIELGMAIVSSYGDTSDLSSKVAKVYDVRRNGIAPRGADWAALNPRIVISPSTWTVGNLGEIFGLALDSFGNVFMSATDVYKLDGQFSFNPGSHAGPAGTGGIYMAQSNDLKQVNSIINTTNAPSLYEYPSLLLPNTGGLGNGIGNMAYDRAHNQLFVSNLEDGKIYRINLNQPNPEIVSSFDPFELDDQQRGISSKQEQVWGLGIFTDTSSNQTKVYFTRQYVTGIQSSAVFSINLNEQGEFDAAYNSTQKVFHTNEILEIELNSTTSIISRITDISFSDHGKMLLAERGHAHKAGIYEFEKNNNDWSQSGSQFHIGSWNLVIGLNGKNAAGGVDYGYRENGNNPYGFCDSLVWATANFMQTPSSGSGFYYGLQGIYSRGNLPVTHMPIYQSNAHTDLYIDFDGPSMPQSNLQVGDVEVFRVSCASFAGAPINPTLACNNLLQVSLDTMGVAYTDIDLVTQGDGSNPCWQLRMYDVDGRLIDHNILTCEHAGTRIDFVVKDTCSQISCWGKIDVEDKYAPQLECGSDTVRCRDTISPYKLGFPVPLSATVFATFDSSIFTVSHWDSCGDVQLHYSDEIVSDFDCEYQFVLRHWTAQDDAGNIASCDDSIYIHVPNLILDTIGIHDVTFTCEDTYPMLPNGNPSPDITGWPLPANCGTLFANYEDNATPKCGVAQKIFRKWTLFDECAKAPFPKKIEFYQFIEISDHIKPVIYCKNNGLIVDTVGTDYYKCSGSYELPVPQSLMKGVQMPDSNGMYVIGECSEWSYSVNHISAVDGTCIVNNSTAISLGASRISSDPAITISDLEQGCNWFEYVIVDDCGNLTKCMIKIVVVDDLAPSVICDAHTKVSLLTQGIVRVPALTFDDGTIDNCELDSFAVRRMDDGQPCGWNNPNFSDYIEFCCADVGQTIMVEFKAIDKAGNEGICMVEVRVEDKIRPRITAPTDITVDCGYLYEMDSLSLYFGAIVSQKTDAKNIYIKNDPNYSASNNWLAGKDGYIEENCDNFTWTDSVITDLKCGMGTIRRIFTVTDQGGLTDIDEQLITIGNIDPFDENDIEWPDDILENPIETDCINGVTTDPSTTGEPTAKSNTKCIDFAIYFDDKTTYGGDSACYKIIRTWTVIDWCQFDRNTNPGWEHVQYIKVANHIAPKFDIGFCEDKVFCDSSAIKSNGNCLAYANLVASAEDDCTANEDLNWRYKLDIGNIGVWDQWIESNDASDHFPIGTHKIRWEVADLCGNVSECAFEFEVKDCKPPTPYCHDKIITVVMPSSGQIEVEAYLLDLGSYDNCTESDDLILAFSEDGLTTKLVYTCDSINGQEFIERTVKLWVIDEYGNKDYCEAIIKIQNNGACDVMTNGLISGNLLTFDEKPIDEVTMTLLKEGQVHNGPSLHDGSYEFKDLVTAKNYRVIATGVSKYDFEVSTRDMVSIQKHLLGYKDFDQAWQFVAADVNNSGKVSAKDITDIRKLILGRDLKFKNRDSWLFYNKGVDLHSKAALYAEGNRIDINQLSGSVVDQNFYGLKIGDVNGDLNGWFGGNAVKTRGDGLVLEADYFIQDNQQILEFKVPENIDLEGLQFTLELDGINILDVTSERMSIDQSNYMLFENKMTFAWSTGESIHIKEGETLLQLRINGVVKNNDFMMMSSQITQASIFYKNEIEEQVSLNINLNDELISPIQIQIAPNPFKGFTKILITLAEASQVGWRIYDCHGKVVHSAQIFLYGGQREILIDQFILTSGPGIYFCEIQTVEGVQRHKLVLVE